MKISAENKEALEKIYSLMPATTCTKTECALQCCTKKKQVMDRNDNFMPLPMVYGAEFLNILNWLQKKHQNNSIENIYDFSTKSRVCPFKDHKSFRCEIYQVRPFSCRLFGRRVPPFIWGVEVSEEQINGIYCPDMKIDEPDRIMKFNTAYQGIWDDLALMTIKEQLFSEHALKILEKETGFPVLLIMGFGEFYFLSTRPDEWWDNHFYTYWQEKEALI